LIYNIFDIITYDMIVNNYVIANIYNYNI